MKKMTDHPRATQRPWGRSNTGVLLGFGCASLLCAVAIGLFTVSSAQPECGTFYTCTRVVDRTLLLGGTSTVLSLGALAASAMAGSRPVRGRRRLVIAARVLLFAVGITLAAAYYVTRFVSLRADMVAQTSAAPATWTASAALWLTVLGLWALGGSAGVAPTKARRSTAVGAAIGATVAVLLTAITLAQG